MRTGELYQRYFGVYLATVKEISDPEGLGRVRVEADQFDDSGEPVWATVARPGAGDGTGVFFTPKVGDQVILGYVVGDIEEPVVLGYAHSQQRKPSDRVGEKKHGIVTDIGSVIFDEEERSMTLTFSEGIESSIRFDATGITIKAPSVKIEATSPGAGLSLSALSAPITLTSTIGQTFSAPVLSFLGMPSFGIPLPNPLAPPLPTSPGPGEPVKFELGRPLEIKTLPETSICVDGKRLALESFVLNTFNNHQHNTSPPGPSPLGTDADLTKCGP